jgi:hypothetical protein
LNEIMKYSWLPNRALEAIVLLSLVLLASLMVLAPGQEPWVLGLELLAVALPAWAIVTAVHRSALTTMPGTFRRPLLVRIVAGQAAIVPFVVAGLSLILHAGGGLYWLLPGIVLANAAGVYNAWVLLVEIIR